MYVTLQQHLGYQMVSTSWARQNFHELLMQSQGAPVGIQRYSRVMAVVWGMPFRSQADRELRLAELEFHVPHLRRLLFHHQLALRLLNGDARRSAALLDGARLHMDRERVSATYSNLPGSAWRTLLVMPAERMVREMLRRDRWGFDLRCISPFYTGDYKATFVTRLDEQLRDCSDFEREHWKRENDDYRALCKSAKDRIYTDWQATWAQTVALWEKPRRNPSAAG